MASDHPLEFKVATEDWEFEQIHRLNYKTFVEEIPQHEKRPDGVLVDRFHEENTYVICRSNHRVLAMIAVRDKRPFSLDHKIHNLQEHLPPARHICEFRLLSVEKDYRHSRIFYGLMATVARYCRERGCDLAVISGTTRQQKLYKHLGFVPFGPLVGDEDALYQPMYLTLDDYMERSEKFFRASSATVAGEALVNLLPGPVSLSRRVRRTFAEAPVSHRSRIFMQDFGRCRRLLCDLVNARHVQLLTGSGTLANDVICAQLTLLPGPGLILSHGEFGRRLIDHATRQGLTFDTLRAEWGEPFDYARIHQALKERPETQWMWAVHCETSTGILNDLEKLKTICADQGVKLCVDCISSIGTVPVDLQDVYLASCVSGKALRSFPGLSMVFHNHDVEPAPDRLPRYLDLGTYAAKGGVPFTIPSNLVYALYTTLKAFQPDKVFEEIQTLSRSLKGRLRSLGLRLVAPEEHAAPAVVTIEVPEGVDSERMGQEIEKAGYLLSYRSGYLLERNWLQVCLMGECSEEQLDLLVDVLRRLTAETVPQH
jgi:aspartate aminotransferase-like enzyme/GNAT superfamily N-acetyltransferase